MMVGVGSMVPWVGPSLSSSGKEMRHRAVTDLPLVHSEGWKAGRETQSLTQEPMRSAPKQYCSVCSRAWGVGLLFASLVLALLHRHFLSLSEGSVWGNA